MATVKWSALTSRGTVLANTDLASKGTGAFSALSAAYDNTTNLDRWGWVELKLGSLTPTAGACVYVYIVPSIDGGTDYDDGPSTTNPGSHMLVAVLSITTGGPAAKKAVTAMPFALPPGLFKFIVRNQTGVTLAATANTMDFFTSNESVA